MRNTDRIVMFQNILSQLPTISVILVGFYVSWVGRSRHPQVSKVTATALGLILTAVVGLRIMPYLTVRQEARNLEDVLWRMFVDSVVSNAVTATGLALLIWAAFGWRRSEDRRRSTKALALLGVSWLVAVGGIPFAAADPGDLAGRVVYKSQGVAGARVWVLHGDGETCKTVAETVADADGRYSFNAFWNRPGRQLPYSVSLFVRDRSGWTGWQSVVYWNSPPPDPIEVVEGTEVGGRLTDQMGRPIVGVEVLPTSLSHSYFSSGTISLSRDVARRHAARTDREGSFTLRHIPKDAMITVTIEAPAFASPSLRWHTTAPMKIVLDSRLGRVRGRIEPNVEPSPQGRMRVFLSEDSGGYVRVNSYALRVYKETRVEADGSFQFDNVPPGRYSIQADTPFDGPYDSQGVYGVTVAPGSAVAGLAVKVRRLPVIEGRVIDAENGQGLAGVNLGVLLGQNPYNSAWHPRASTDAQGRYRVSIPHPPRLVQVVPGHTKTNTGLHSDIWPKLNVGGDQKWPDLKLARSLTVDGIAVDGQGRPVPGANVFVISPHDLPQALKGPTTVTQPDGTFRLEQLIPDDNITVLSRTDTAATNPDVSIRPREQRGRLTLTIEPARSWRIRGMVTNRVGGPIEGAKVSLWWGRYPAFNWGQPSGARGTLDVYTTDASGRFVTRALWTGERFKVTVEAEGYGKAETPEGTGRAGEERDLGRIVLEDTSGYVSGTVVDAAGQPFARASVFNRGDAPDLASTWTDEKGRFRLEGLYPGGKYVFASVPTYRLAGVRIDGNAGDVKIRLVRDNEPPLAPWKPVEPPRYEVQRTIADRIVTRLWERYGQDADNNGASGCILVMARLDLKRALAWSAVHGGRYDDAIRRIAAEQLAETDGGAALDLLRTDRDAPGQNLLQDLADRFANSDRAKALRFAEEAAIRARALDPSPERTAAMARAGSLLVRLGRQDDGRADRGVRRDGLPNRDRRQGSRDPRPGRRFARTNRSEPRNAADRAHPATERARGCRLPCRPGDRRDQPGACPRHGRCDENGIRRQAADQGGDCLQGRLQEPQPCAGHRRADRRSHCRNYCRGVRVAGGSGLLRRSGPSLGYQPDRLCPQAARPSRAIQRIWRRDSLGRLDRRTLTECRLSGHG